jgi:glycine/D-amino acid oxidase-like deaminating enzyme
LFAWTKSRFPQVSEIVDKWSGQIIEPTDGMAFIGRNPGDYSNIFIVTGGKLCCKILK